MKRLFLCGPAVLALGMGLFGCGSAQSSEDIDNTELALLAPLTVFDNPFGDGTSNPTAGGSGFVVSNATGDGTTHVVLQVRGLPPNRKFGAHVHQLACNNNKAGGHYRNDPAAGATPQNEIWLDFTTNDAGNGHAQAIADFLIRTGEARAVIIHDHTTDAAGVAGPKLACIDHNFDN